MSQAPLIPVLIISKVNALYLKCMFLIEEVVVIVTFLSLQSDSESDFSLAHRGPHSGTSSRVSGVPSAMRPTISSQNKINNKNSSGGRRRSLTSAFSAG